MTLTVIRNQSLFLAIFLLLSPLRASAAFGFQLDGSLDKNAISKSYFEGDFHRILPPLEAWRNSRSPKTREDSIFVYKYLSVIYAADSTTRPRAESYMVQLLKLMPTIELVDMYISDNIEAIFKDVKGKFLDQQQYIRNHDELGRTRQDSATVIAKNDSKTGKLGPAKSNQWIWWTVGGVGLAAAVAGSYYAFHEESSSPTNKSFEP